MKLKEIVSDGMDRTYGKGIYKIMRISLPKKI